MLLYNMFDYLLYTVHYIYSSLLFCAFVYINKFKIFVNIKFLMGMIYNGICQRKWSGLYVRRDPKCAQERETIVHIASSTRDLHTNYQSIAMKGALLLSRPDVLRSSNDQMTNCFSQ